MRHRSRSARAKVAATLVVLTVLVSGVVALTAIDEGRALAANQVSCGDTITTDVTLHHNLHCPNNGIIIGADNITLDLNYHTIDGDGTPAAGCDPNTEFCDTGMVNFGHDDVTVVHGSVREFTVGLDLGAARHLRVLGVSAVRNGSWGMFLGRCVRCLVRNSAGNRTKGGNPDQTGMLLFESRHDRVLHSSFRRNAGPGILSASLGGENANTVIRGNRFSHNGAEGFFMEGGDHFQIRHNRSVGNRGGIACGPGSDNVISRNRVSRNGPGITVAKGHGNLIAHNVVAHSRRGGIRLAPAGAGAHNFVRRNLVKDSGGDGFLVGKGDRHSRLKGNVAKRSGDDGFDITSRSAKLTSNQAVRNTDLGIEAVPGVIDGGSNRASGNGDLRQCINIVCN